MQTPFVIGQRWLSEAEPDLGLGIVVSTDIRQVSIDFPAVSATRTYAVQEPPLARVRFTAGDIVEDDNGGSWKVARVEEVDGRLTYHCTDLDEAQVQVLEEQALSARLQVNRPHDRLLARRIDPDVWFTLRLQTWRQNAELQSSEVFGFAGPRIEWLPHQLHIAAEVSNRAAPRVLLADEVGLGKTIEAGLVLHRLVMTDRVKRVLLIVPEPLVHQWLVEMLRRFNLTFAVFNEARFDAAAAGSENPFESEQRVLCSLDFLVSSPKVAQAVLDSAWDLLIVDEAHHLAWDEHDASLAYSAVEALAAQTAAVLLLTATPEQLGRAGHFGRLRLLDPQRFHDYRAFVAEEEDYADVAAIADRLLAGEALPEAQQQRLAAMLGDEAQLPRGQVIARLIDRHGTGRVLFRNTRQAVTGFPARALTTYPLPLPEVYRAHAAELTPEQPAGAGWTAIDPRVDWLLALCRELAPQKLLVIAAHAATVVGLREHLLERAALHAAVFHEDMDIVARDRAAAFFADPDEGSQVLLCSEIGSEGRNFQFAHHLVMFDLPFEPELLEQRIGRLDRIGQRDTISIHVPYFPDSASEVLMRWYRDGLGSFEAICAAAPAVHEQLRDALTETLAARDGLSSLVQRAQALTTQINGELERGRDRLLELHSSQPARAAALIDALQTSTEVVPLLDYMGAYWDAYGIEHEQGPGASTILRPGAHMHGEHFPGLLSEGATVTFDRQDALAHEDRQFLTWEHPMVRGCMDLLSSGPLGGAAVTVCSHPNYRTGTLFVEALFVVECLAPAELAMPRFLPPTCIRLLIDTHGEDCAERLAHDDLRGLCLAQNRKLADTVIRSLQDRLALLLERAEQLAQAQAHATVAKAKKAVVDELGAEHQRLTALAQVNANVRDEELTDLVARQDRLLALLDEPQVRLDALRVVVMR